MIGLEEIERMLEAGDRYGHATSPAVVLDLITEVRRLRVDADRYRFLRHIDRRECLTKNGPAAGCWIDSENERGVLVLLTEEDADAAVDAAIAAHPKEGV